VPWLGIHPIKSLCRGTSGPYRARTRAKGDFRYRTAASIKQRYRQPRAGAEINAKGALERTPPHRCSFSGGNLRDTLFGRRKFASPSGGRWRFGLRLRPRYRIIRGNQSSCNTLAP